MLEILLLVFLGKKIASIVRERGRSPLWYVVALVGFWFGGQILGGIVGTMLADGDVGGFAYICALLGGILGAVAAFMLAQNATQQAVRYDAPTYGFPVAVAATTPVPGGVPTGPPQQVLPTDPVAPQLGVASRPVPPYDHHAR